MARTTRLTALIVAAGLLTGCAAAATDTGPVPTSAATHVMPDGSTMAGAEHGDHEQATETDGAGPSAAAQMVCAGQVVTAVTSIFDLEGDATPDSMWEEPTYSCTFDVDGAPLVLTVHDTDDPEAGLAHFDELQSSLPEAREIEGMLGLGLPSFATDTGVVGFLKDGRTLTVDATALPDGFGGGARTQHDAAYAVASAVLTCWVEHD